MPKKQPSAQVTRTLLLSALDNIPEDAPLWIGRAVNPDEDFSQGLRLNRSERVTKSQLLAEIGASPFQLLPAIPEHDRYLLLNPRLYIWKDAINQSQRFPAVPDAERYIHVVDKSNPYYDVYFHLDREHKTITFALGLMKKEVPVVEGTDWCRKPTRKGILCQDIGRLEKNFLDPFWNPIAVNVGRKVLRIEPIV